MANAVYGESRGEPYEGQVAVAAVILNRLRSPEFPNSISGVIFQSLAFTAVADGQIWLTPNDRAKKAVQDAINGLDPHGWLPVLFQPRNGNVQMDLEPSSGEDDRQAYFLHVTSEAAGQGKPVPGCFFCLHCDRMEGHPPEWNCFPKKGVQL